MANLMNPADIATAYQGGLLFGQQQRDRKRMEGEREQLRNLAPQIMQGDPAAYTQAAVINPEAAGQYQSAGDQQYRRLMNVSKMMRDAINTGNPTAKQRAFQTIKPFLSQMAPGRPIPEQWDDSLLPGFEQFENRISMAAGPEAQQRNLSVSPGSAIVDPATGQVIYERPFAPQQQSFEMNGPDGRPRRYTFNTRTGQYEEAALGGSQEISAPPPAEASQRLNAIVQTLRQQGLTPEQIQAAMPAFEQAVLAPAGGPAMGGAPLVGRAPEEQAALTTGAQEAARLQYLPQQEAIKTQAAIQQAGGVAQAQADIKRTTERSAAQVEKDTAFRLYQAGIKGLSEGLAGSETGPIMGRIPAFTTEQQIAEGGVAAMAPILKQLFRSAGEGTFTDKDQDLLLAMIPTRTDTEDARAAKLANIDSLVRAKLGQTAQGSTGNAGPQPGTVEQGYRFKGGNPADPNSWERL
jgi:hypothetical protein